MRQYGIQVHSQLRAGGIAVNPRPMGPVADVVPAGDHCTQQFTACRTNKMKSGMPPNMVNTFCKTQLKQCQEAVV